MTEFPHKIVAVDGQDDLNVRSAFKSIRSGLIRIGEKGWVMPNDYRHHAAHIYNMPVREDDVWLVTFPKSGTTVTQELVWLLMNNLDYKKSKELPLFERSRFIEHSSLYHKDVISEAVVENPDHVEEVKSMGVPRYEMAASEPSPRVIKTHMPFSLLPPNLETKCKVIYVARNPKDVSVSYFHHNSSSKAYGYSGDFEQYLKEFFVKDLVISGPYWPHVIEGWQKRDHPNILFFFYEDLIKDMKSTVKKVADFLGKKLSEEEMDKLISHLQIDNFRENVKIRNIHEFKAYMYVNPKAFIRKGGVGKNKEITPELNEVLEEWIKKYQAGVNIPFQMK